MCVLVRGPLLHSVGPRARTQVIWLGGKHLYSLRRLTGPFENKKLDRAWISIKGTVDGQGSLNPERLVMVLGPTWQKCEVCKSEVATNQSFPPVHLNIECHDLPVGEHGTERRLGSHVVGSKPSPTTCSLSNPGLTLVCTSISLSAKSRFVSHEPA